MSDLLNDPGSLCSCGGKGCEEASAWAEGPIVEPALARVGMHGRPDGPPPGATVAEAAAHERAVLRAWWVSYRAQAWVDIVGVERPSDFQRLIEAVGVRLTDWQRKLAAAIFTPKARRTRDRFTLHPPTRDGSAAFHAAARAGAGLLPPSILSHYSEGEGTTR